jgi:hypothetical protein
MSLDNNLEKLKTLLSDAMPTRIITRNFKSHEEYASIDLKKDIVTITSVGLDIETNSLQESNSHIIALFGWVEADDRASVEQKELTLITEIREALKDSCYYITNIRQSAQIEHPFGWVAFDLFYKE